MYVSQRVSSWVVSGYDYKCFLPLWLAMRVIEGVDRETTQVVLDERSAEVSPIHGG